MKCLNHVQVMPLVLFSVKVMFYVSAILPISIFLSAKALTIKIR